MRRLLIAWLALCVALIVGVNLAVPRIPSGGSVASGSDAMQALVNATPAGAWFDTGMKLSQIAYVGPGTYNGLNCTGGPPYTGASPPSVFGTNGSPAVLYAWNTPTFDSDNKRLLMVSEGGHNDYYGNEAYALNFPTLTWSMLRCPDAVGTFSGEVNVLPNGNPSSRHTYGGEIYKPLGAAGSNAGDVFLINGAPMSTTGGGSHGAFSYNAATNTYATVGNPTNASDGTQGGAVYCPSGANAGKIFFGAAGNDFESFDGQNFTQLNSTGYGIGSGTPEMSPSIGPNCNIYWIGNGGGGGIIQMFTPSGSGPTTLVTSGATPPCLGDSFPGHDWDPDDGHNILYCGGTTVYKIDLSHAGTAGDPVPITAITQVGSAVGPQCSDTPLHCSTSEGVQIAGMWKHGFYVALNYHIFCVIMSVNDDMWCRKRNAATD